MALSKVKTIKEILRVMIREVLLASELLVPTKGIPVLLYHNTADNNETPHIPNVTTIEFEKQIRYLASKGFKTLTIAELMDILSGKQDLPQKRVIITFDDGYSSNLKAFSILKKYGFTSICFIATAFIGKEYNYMPFSLTKLDVTYEESDIKNQKFKFMSESDIREANSNGVEFCSHTHRHIELPEYSDDIIEEEVKQSQQMIEKITTDRTNSFSFPVGKYTEHNIELLKKLGIETAFTVDSGVVCKDTSPMLIPRTNVVGDMRMFRLLLTNKYKLYQMLSNTINS